MNHTRVRSVLVAGIVGLTRTFSTGSSADQVASEGRSLDRVAGGWPGLAIGARWGRGPRADGLGKSCPLIFLPHGRYMEDDARALFGAYAETPTGEGESIRLNNAGGVVVFNLGVCRPVYFTASAPKCWAGRIKLSNQSGRD